MSLAHTATHPILPHTRAAAADAAVAVPTTLRGEIALALPMRHAGVRTLVLRYELQGPADAPVVFLAGGISAHRHASASTAFPESGWANALVAAGRALDPARHRILAFDYVGADGHLDAPIDTTDQADAIAALLNALDIDQLRAFVGYSYGAMVGLQFAARHPTRLQRLVAVSGAHKPHPYASAWRALQRRAVALGQLQCADAQGLALARQTLQTQQDAYGLVRRQAEQALVTELDVRRAQIPVETARADMARYSLRVAQDRHALDLLVGSAVPEALLPRGLSQVALAQEVVPGLPSEVLLARPDVLAAEHQLRAAHAIIGAARAAFFPRLALTSTVGTASTELSRLFENGRGTWAFAPALSMPIFDARVWSAYRVSGVQRQIALTQYERAIQSAFREVADALALRRAVAEQRAAQEALVEALTETHRLAQMRFERGIDSYLSVLDAQRSLFAGQQGLIAVQLAQRLSQVQLFAALGGGWQAPARAAVGAGS